MPRYAAYLRRFALPANRSLGNLPSSSGSSALAASYRLLTNTQARRLSSVGAINPIGRSGRAHN